MIYELLMATEGYGFYNDFKNFFDYYYSDFASNYNEEAVDFLSTLFTGLTSVFLAFLAIYALYKIIFIVLRWFVKW